MSIAPQRRMLMSEPMSWTEICAQFPDQHVFVADVKRGDGATPFTTARVAGFGTSFIEARACAAASGHRFDTIEHFMCGTIEIRCLPRYVVADEDRELLRVRRRPHRR